MGEVVRGRLGVEYTLAGWICCCQDRGSCLSSRHCRQPCPASANTRPARHCPGSTATAAKIEAPGAGGPLPARPHTPP